MLEKLIVVNGAHTGFVDAEVRSGRYTEEDRNAWIAAWSQPGSTTAGLNDYRANHRNAPFNDRHPASTIPTSWWAKEVTEGATSTIIKTPTLVIWGMKDNAILSGHLSGLDKWVTSLSVRLYPDVTTGWCCVYGTCTTASFDTGPAPHAAVACTRM